MRIPSLTVRRRPRIEIIPLIDIIFFLLATFVMVSLSMVKNQAIAVRLPVAMTGSAQERSTFATVTVAEAGVVYLDHEPMDMETLSGRLNDRYQAEPELRVFLHGDERASFGSAIQVLDEIRKLGITKVAIQTRTPTVERQ